MKILLVEDDGNDAALLERALRRTGFSGQLEKVASAEEATKCLTTCFQKSPAELPNLIILDLSLPGKSGLEFLEWLGHQLVLCVIPVIVLSNTPYSRDVNRAYRLGAKTFFVKPLSAPDLESLALSIVNYWGASTKETPDAGSFPGSISPPSCP